MSVNTCMQIGFNKGTTCSFEVIIKVWFSYNKYLQDCDFWFGKYKTTHLCDVTKLSGGHLFLLCVSCDVGVGKQQ